MMENDPVSAVHFEDKTKEMKVVILEDCIDNIAEN